MTTPLASNTSQSARLMVDAPLYAVGWQEPVYIPNPAPGASFTYTIDGRYWERVVGIYFVLATSAVVANRTSQFNILDVEGRVITVIGAGVTVTASQQKFCALMIDNPVVEGAIPSGSVGWLPNLLLPSGYQWQLAIQNIDVADQVSGIVLLNQRFMNDVTTVQAGD